MSTQILVDTPATVSASYYVDGTIADPGAVTVTITKADGTALYTDAATSGTGAAARTKALTASDTANLDVLTAVWTSPTYGDLVTVVEVVGGLLFTESEARAFDNGALATSQNQSPSDDDISEARAMITEAFEQRCEVSFIPRYKRVVLNGDGTDTIMVPDIRIRDVRSVEYRDSGGTTWTAFTSTELDDLFFEDYGVVIRETLGTFPRGRRNIRIGYEYGYDRPPLEINRAALLVARDTLVSSNIDTRAMSFTDQLGTYRFVTPGITRNAMYSNPEVNAILQQYVEKVPVVG